MHKCSILLSITLLIALSIFAFSCSRNAVPAAQTSDRDSPQTRLSGPPCIVYKTKADYSRNVPVILSDDRLQIVSFPAVTDVGRNGAYPYPTPLEMGYLLDNRGITEKVAFLDFTYETYSHLSLTPNAAELMKHLLDANPLVEMYRCGNKSAYNDVTGAMNGKIQNGFQNCTKLK